MDITFLIVNLYLNFHFVSSENNSDMEANINYHTIDNEKDPYNEAKNLILFKNSMKFI